MSMHSHYLLGLDRQGFHRLHYLEWPGPSDSATVVCVHGLTRNARDFDTLAEALRSQRRVVCPDVVGRGASDWLPEGEEYGFAQYLADMNALLARLDVAAVDWIGTSMGGLIGLMLAAQPKTPIRRLVLNDVGPHIDKCAFERIAAYVTEKPHFADLSEAEAYLRRVHAPFGPLSDAQWRHMTEHSTRQVDGGGYALHYDPAIARPYEQGPIEALDLWPLWDAIDCPVLVLRGGESDVLTAKTAQAMTERGPRAELTTFEGIGHAPALMAANQIERIRAWL